MSNFDTLDAALFADNLRNILTSYEGGIEEFVRAGSDVILGTAQNLRRQGKISGNKEVGEKLVVASKGLPHSSLHFSSLLQELVNSKIYSSV